MTDRTPAGKPSQAASGPPPIIPRPSAVRIAAQLPAMTPEITQLRRDLQALGGQPASETDGSASGPAPVVPRPAR